ncbi:MAG: alginate export family protein [Leptospira sp.]|nr:alginate export family protein [Leptospira sp.]
MLAVEPDSIKLTSTEEKYKSPMIEKGIDSDFTKHMFIEPELAAKVNKSQQMWINDIIRLGIYLRPRQEVRNNLDFNRTNSGYTDRTLQTSSLYLLIDPNPYVTAKITFQDARVWGGDSPASSGDIRAVFFNNTPNISSAGQTTSTSLNTTGIREAFVMLKKLPLDAKLQVGRQIWTYGDQRMIGGANWTINGLSYDGARLFIERPIFKIHLFAARPYWTQSGVNGVVSANDPKSNANAKGSDTTLFGTYNSVKLFDVVMLDLYSINIVRKWIPNSYNGTTGLPNVSSDDPIAQNRAKQNQEIYTLGFRLTNRIANNFLPKGEAWDWTWESAWQGGTTGRRLNEKILGVSLDPPYQSLKTEREKYTGQFHVIQTGYTFFEKLRFGVQVLYASGDKNRSDGSSSTFQTLANPRFGTIPFFNGVAGISENIGTKNLISKSISVSYNTNDWGNFQLSYFQNDKAEKQDAWYAINGANNSSSDLSAINSSPVSSAKGSTENFSDNPYTQSYSLGKSIYNEIDLTWMALINDNVSIWLGVGYLKAGNSISNYRNSPLLYQASTNSYELNSDFFQGKNKVAKDGSMAYLQLNAAF